MLSGTSFIPCAVSYQKVTYLERSVITNFETEVILVCTHYYGLCLIFLFLVVTYLLFTQFFFFYYFYLFLSFWLCWVFISARGLSPVAASGGHPSSRCAGLSLSWPLLLRSTGSRCAGSAVVAHGPSCSAACGIPPEQGSNPRPLH